MGTLIGGILDNESFFGKMMTKVGIIIAANIMFILISIPVITIGPGLVALYHVMLKTLRGDGVLNPFKEFWIGFKSNFKQSIICWIVVILLFAFGAFDVAICKAAGGAIGMFRYPMYLIGGIMLAVVLYLLPVMAAFADTIPHLLRNSVFFAVKSPLKFLVIMFFDIFPMYLTFTDAKFLPLYSFLWCFFGFGAIAMIGSTLLVKEFAPFLDKDKNDDDDDDHIDMDYDEEKMLEELRMMDGL